MGDNSDVLDLLQRAQGYLQENRLDEAEAALKRALKIEPKQAESLYYLGLIARKRGQSKLALRWFHSALQHAPDNALLLFNIAALHGKSGRVDKAIEFYRRTLKHAPYHAGCHNNLGVLLLSAGRFAEAARSFAEAAVIDPGGILQWENLEICLQNGVPAAFFSVISGRHYAPPSGRK